MATTSVDATYQGRIDKSSDGNWSTDVRNAASGDIPETFTTNTITTGIRAGRISFGRTSFKFILRTFLFFDNIDTAVGGGTVTAATLKVLGNGGLSTTDTIVIKATAWGGSGGTSTLAASDYGNVTFATTYASELLSWNTSGYNDYSLNATAISDINTNGYFNCAVIEAQYDYDNVEPAIGVDDSAGVEFLNASNKIKLDITFTPAGYGNKVIGILPDNISKVVGITSSTIAKVIGIS
jgi:hypothetical protein